MCGVRVETFAAELHAALQLHLTTTAQHGASKAVQLRLTTFPITTSGRLGYVFKKPRAGH